MKKRILSGILAALMLLTPTFAAGEGVAAAAGQDSAAAGENRATEAAMLTSVKL